MILIKKNFIPQIFKSIIIILLLTLGFKTLIAQENKNYRIACIAFYNLENLFDTINNEGVNDVEFTPAGKSYWTSDKYQKKLSGLAEVISQIGTGLTPDGPAIIGVSEIENRGVLEDLVNEPQLKPLNFQIIHYNSPDRRGVDVALLYQPKYFKITGTKSHRLIIEKKDGFFTRDQLLVSGILDNDTLHIIVNHWPSRRGGEKRSQPLRIAAADLSRKIIDSLSTINPNAKIILMGDLNDNPNNQSIRKHLRANGDIDNMETGELYNPMEKLYKKGIGSNAWRDSWSLFDQIIVTPSLVGEDNNSWKLHKAKVFNKKFLIQTDGRYKGYPNRTYAGGVYLGGYSDHFPVYIYLIKEVN